MTVRELIEMLENCPEDMEIVVQGSNSDYAEEIDRARRGYGVRAYYGDDYEAVVLTCEGQVGAVWDLDELDIAPNLQKVVKGVVLLIAVVFEIFNNKDTKKA